jgi:hypothetical protein
MAHPGELEIARESSCKIMNRDKNLEFWNALRRAKRIRSPLLGWALIALGLLTGGALIVSSGIYIYNFYDTSMTNKWKLFSCFLFLGIFAGSPFVLIGRRFAQKKGEHALGAGGGKIRPFILYLRSFKTDVGWHGWVTEPRLSRVLKQAGVPVCVGRPDERLPQFGFHRIYFADEDWQASVLEMASRAKCIVVVIGDTGGLVWEMRQLIENRWLEKTVLLVPARGHELHRVTLREQHGIEIPSLQSHYCTPYTPGPFDLCPIGFEGTLPVGIMVVPTLLYIAPENLILDRMFCRAMRMMMAIIPPLKRYDWLIERNRSILHMNFGLTLEPFLKHIDPSYNYKDRFMERYR